MSVRSSLFVVLASMLVSGPVSAQTGAAAPVQPSAQPHLSERNVPIEQGARRELVVEGLEHPWSMAWLPDGTMLVTERPGRLRLVRNGALVAEPVSGAPAVLAAGQGGLLDVAVHPDFATNRTVFLTYAAGTAQANRTTIARARLDNDRLSDVTVIFETSQAKPGGQHFGSRIAFLTDGSMLVSIGDGGNPPTSLDGRFIRENAQSTASHWGKIIRILPDGSAAPGNPFASTTGALPHLWSIGHRNIQGLAVDPVTGRVWANEHGSLGGDELNLVSAGANHGWPVVSRTREYVSGAPVGGARSAPGMVEPVLLWETSTAPSGLAVYRGAAFPGLQGALLSGSLISQDVRVIRTDASGRVTGETALRVGQRVRDVRVGPDGFIYVLTDERAGRLFRYRPADGGQTAPQPATGRP